MPHSVMLTLVPAESREFDISLGQQVHALFLNTIRKVDPVLSRELHDSSVGKPFTVSLPINAKRRPINRFVAAQECYVRYTVFSDEIWDIFPEIMKKLTDGTTHISNTDVEVVDISFTCEENIFGSQTFQEMYETPLASKFQFKFVTPTSFRLQGHSFLLPLPSLMYCGYLRKWNKYSNIKFAEDILDNINDRLLISKVNLSSQVLQFSRYFQIGFTGQVLLNAANFSKEEQRILTTLTLFAHFCGTGHKTTMGMGQTRIRLYR